MTNQGRIIAFNSSFGFVFRMVNNGGGPGAAPKLYSVTDPANQFLLGFTDDNVPGVSLGWPSDPGDSPDPANRTPPGSRAYEPDLSPNNIRLSQVNLLSLRMTHGITREADRPYLPTSSFFNRSVAGPPAPNDIVGDFSGCRRITVQWVGYDVGSEGVVIVNGLALGLSIPSQDLAQQPNKHTFHLTNLGAVQVVNLNNRPVTIGVHVECDL